MYTGLDSFRIRVKDVATDDSSRHGLAISFTSRPFIVAFDLLTRLAGLAIINLTEGGLGGRLLYQNQGELPVEVKSDVVEVGTGWSRKRTPP